MGIPMPPPWVLLSLVLGFSKNLQNIKDVAGLGFSIVTGNGEEAGCKLCDKLVTLVLEQVELDDMSDGGGVDCPSICFGFGKCVDSCEKITGAMANSTGYPCDSVLHRKAIHTVAMRSGSPAGFADAPMAAECLAECWA